jgi:nonsense-mediated mRNA decay protein 3
MRRLQKDLYSPHLEYKGSNPSKNRPSAHGFDVHFTDKAPAKRFVEFVQGHAPSNVKSSKQLISTDVKSNIYNYKYVYSVEIAPICKNDLLIMPYGVRVPGLGPVLLCTKITSQIHFLDVSSFQTAELKASQYWKNPFPVYASKDRLSEFIVLDVEETNGKFDLEVARNNDERFGEVTYRIWSQIGRGITSGDMVLGYDLTTIVDHQWADRIVAEAPDVILVSKAKENKKKMGKRLQGLEGKEISESEKENDREENKEEVKGEEIKHNSEN